MLSSEESPWMEIAMYGKRWAHPTATRTMQYVQKMAQQAGVQDRCKYNHEIRCGVYSDCESCRKACGEGF